MELKGEVIGERRRKGEQRMEARRFLICTSVGMMMLARRNIKTQKKVHVRRYKKGTTATSDDEVMGLMN